MVAVFPAHCCGRLLYVYFRVVHDFFANSVVGGFVFVLHGVSYLDMSLIVMVMVGTVLLICGSGFRGWSVVRPEASKFLVCGPLFLHVCLAMLGALRCRDGGWASWESCVCLTRRVPCPTLVRPQLLLFLSPRSLLRYDELCGCGTSCIWVVAGMGEFSARYRELRSGPLLLLRVDCGSVLGPSLWSRRSFLTLGESWKRYG